MVLGAVQSVLGSPWLCPVWWAALGLPCRVRALSRGAWGLLCRCGVQASHCRGFSRCGARPRGACTSEVATRWLSSCGTHGMWDLPRSGIEPVSAALQGGFLTTGSPGKSSRSLLIVYFVYSIVYMFILIYPPSHLSPLVTVSLLSTSVSLFLFCK